MVEQSDQKPKFQPSVDELALIHKHLGKDAIVDGGYKETVTLSRL